MGLKSTGITTGSVPAPKSGNPKEAAQPKRLPTFAMHAKNVR
jgi:hypothetical protein